MKKTRALPATGRETLSRRRWVRRREESERLTRRSRGRSKTVVSELLRTHARAVYPNTGAYDLATVFANEPVPAVAVVDDSGRLEGFVTRADIGALSSETARQAEPCGFWSCPLVEPGDSSSRWSIDTDRTQRHDERAELTAADLMTTVGCAVGPDAPVGQAVAMMVFAGLEILPVIGRSREVVGLLSSSDVLRWLAERSGYLQLEKEGAERAA